MIPKQFILEVTNRCNLKCKYCPNVQNVGYGSFPVGDMDFEFFKSVIDRIVIEAPESVVIPWMNGEPFLAPNYLEMVKYISGKGLKFYVTTNLTIWKEELLEYLLSEESTCYQLIVSLDGCFGTGSIGTARPGTSEEKLRYNLDRLLQMKKSSGSKIDLAVKICERGQDWGEIEDYIQEWLEQDEISYVCVGKPLKDENEISMRTQPCQYFDRNFMVIRWDGTLVPCAYNDKVTNRLMLSYGKLDRTESLIQAYARLDWLREWQDKGVFPEPCGHCAFAYTGLGFKGVVSFRAPRFAGPIFYHQDYYNMFFSRKEKVKSDEYYRR